MTTSHFIVELRDGAREGDVSKLAVHVVSTTSRRVTQPNAVILDCAGTLFHQLHHIENFTSSLFHLVKLVQVIPKLGSGNDLVGRKDNHAVGLRIGVFFGGGMAAHHLVLTHQASDSHL